MLTTCIPLIALLNGFACVDMETTITPAEVVSMAEIAGFEDEHMDTLLCVIKWESSFRPGAISWNNTSFGLTQVHRNWSEGFYLPTGERLPPDRPDLTPQALMDPMTAMHAAYYIFERSGWTAWDAYKIHCEDLWK